MSKDAKLYDCDSSYAGVKGCTGAGPIRSDGLPHCDVCWYYNCWEDFVDRHDPLPTDVPPPSLEWLIEQIRRDKRWITQQVNAYNERIDRKLILLSNLLK